MNETVDLSEQEIDLRQYLQILIKWRWVIVLITLVSIGTAGVLSFLVIPPVYEAKATLLVTHGTSEQKAVYTESTDVVNTMSRLPIMNINSYVGQLKSPYYLSRVIKAAKLDPNTYTPEGLSAAMQVTAIKDTNLIEVRIQNRDPELAASLVNTACREFLAFITENNEEQMAKSVKFFEQQEEVVSKQLSAAREKVKALVQPSKGVDALEKQVNDLTAEISTVRSQLLRAQVDRGLLEAGRSKLQEELEKTPQTLKDAPNPVYDELMKSLKAKDVALAEKAAEIEGLTNSLNQLNTELQSLQTELNTKKDQYEAAQKEVRDLEDTLSLIKQKKIQTQMAQSVNLGETNISLVSPALVPAVPIKPRKTLNMAVAGVLGLMVSVVLAFLLEYMDDTIKTAEDVARALDLPTLGNIPVFGKR